MLDFRNMARVVQIIFLLLQTGCSPAVETTAMTIDRASYDPAVARYPVSTIRADLLTVKDGRVVTSFASTREGTDTMLGLVLVPVPIPANTEGAVCAEMTREIDSFLQSVDAANRVTAGHRVQQ